MSTSSDGNSSSVMWCVLWACWVYCFSYQSSLIRGSVLCGIEESNLLLFPSYSPRWCLN